MAAVKEAARNSATTKIGGVFSNYYLTAEKVEKPTYTRWRITLGEQGRGRKLLDLTCPEGMKVLKGQNPNLTIGSTRSGNHKLVSASVDKQYLLLSAEGTYARCGNGKVYWNLNNSSKYTLLENGWGAYGDAGRIGYWDAVLLAIDGAAEAVNDWICVRPSGRREWDCCKYVFIGSGEILYFEELEDVRGFCEARDIDEPNMDWTDPVWEDVTETNPAESD